MRKLWLLALLLVLAVPETASAFRNRARTRSANGRPGRITTPTRARARIRRSVARRAEQPGAALVRPADQVGQIKHRAAQQDGERGTFSMRDGEARIGAISYIRQGDVLSVDHTVVEPAFRGRGFATRLVNEVVEYARANRLKIQPACNFAVHAFAKNSAYADVLAAAE